MAFDYVELRDDVAEPLLNEFGSAATLVVDGEAMGVNDYDPQFDDPTEYAVIALPTRFTEDNNNGTLVQETDRLFIVSTEGTFPEPDLANRFKIDGVTYQIIRIDPLRHNGTNLLWYVHVRK